VFIQDILRNLKDEKDATQDEINELKASEVSKYKLKGERRA
jgi:hypothetical protein